MPLWSFANVQFVDWFCDFVFFQISDSSTESDASVTSATSSTLSSVSLLSRQSSASNQNVVIPESTELLRRQSSGGSNQPGKASSTASLAADTPTAAGNTADDMTTGIGTHFYISPEQEHSGDGPARYDVKVPTHLFDFVKDVFCLTPTCNCLDVNHSIQTDVYSLGIMLFEFWYPFESTSERHTALNALRKHGAFPPHFAESHPRQVCNFLLHVSEDVFSIGLGLLDLKSVRSKSFAG